MLETELKKLTEALTENNRLLQEHVDIRKTNKPDGTRGDDPQTDKGDAAAEEKAEAAAAEKKAEAAAEKKRKAAEAKKAKEAEAAKAKEEAEVEEPEEKDDEPEEKAEGDVTADDLREYVQGIRVKLKKDDGPKAVSKHRKDFRELLKDGGYNSISDIPEDEMSDFLEDTKALVE
jgi:sRNA-binding protein